MPNLRGSEWLIIVLVIALLFGAKRLPDAARSIGRSLRIFKAETKGLVDGESSDAAAAAPAATASAVPAPAPAPLPAQPSTPSAAPTSLPEAVTPALQPNGEATPTALQQPPTSA